MSGDLLYTILVIGAFAAFTVSLAGGAIYTGLKPSSRGSQEVSSKR